MEAPLTTLLHSAEGAVVIACALSEDYVAVTLDDHSVHVLSAHSGDYKSRFTDPNGIAWSVALAADLVLVGSVDGSLTAYDIPHGKIHSSMPGPPKASRSSVISLLKVLRPSSPLTVLAASEDGKLRVPNFDNQQCTLVLEGGHSSGLFGVHAISEKKVLSAAYEGSLCSWNLETGKLDWQLKFEVAMHALELAADGTIIVGFRDGRIKILSGNDRSELAVFAAHEKVVNGMRLYDDLLVSTGTDGWARVWSTQGCKPLRQVKMFDKSFVSRCMFGPWLIAAGKNGGPVDDVCGLDSCVSSWRVDGNSPEDVIDLSAAVPSVWKVDCIDDKVVAWLVIRGKPAVQIWPAVMINEHK